MLACDSVSVSLSQCGRWFSSHTIPSLYVLVQYDAQSNASKRRLWVIYIPRRWTLKRSKKLRWSHGNCLCKSIFTHWMVLLGYHMSHHFFSLYKSIFQPSNTVVVVQVQNDCRGLVSMCSINDATKPLACTMTLCFFLFKKLLSSVLCNTRKWVFLCHIVLLFLPFFFCTSRFELWDQNKLSKNVMAHSA